MLEGALEVLYGDERYSMQPGDVLEFAVDRPVSYISGQDDGCRYLLNLLYQ
ncbi:transcriptional regulator [Pseudomonas putida]|nr:transcriptional regulator [Pseudomonas putida]